jgi:aspartate racemase
VVKHIGIVGVSAEGAALCCRTICAESAAILGPHMHPEITLHTFALGRYMKHIAASDWEGVADLMLASTRKLAQCGADFVVCPDNTAHQAMDLVVSKSPLPWLHIAEEVAEVAATRQFKDVAVLGTRYLMEGPVYPSKLSARGIRHQIPEPEERHRINQIIFQELVYARFEVDSRRYFQQVVHKLKRRGCDAVALACTEIPLLITEKDSALPVLDSTRILARAALRRAVADS